MHIFLKSPQYISCKKCGKEVLSHTLCDNCGTYRGKEMIDVLAKLNKKEKKQKQKDLAASEKSEARNPKSETSTNA